jgi:hypothetical protein
MLLGMRGVPKGIRLLFPETRVSLTSVTSVTGIRCYPEKHGNVSK